MSLITPPPIDGIKTLKVTFYRAGEDEVTIHFITLPKQSTIGDVLNDLKTKVELSRPDAELRLLEVFYHKIYKIFPLDERIENINDQYWTLRAEEIPEEEKNLDPHSRLIHVYHFMTDTAQNQAWKFAFLSLGRPQYLQDSDIVYNLFDRRGVYGSWEQYLGLEHSDNAPNDHAANGMHYAYARVVTAYL